jgi:hypothetical protein
MLVEVTETGKSKALPTFAKVMGVAVVENFGQVKGTDPAGKPLSKDYVKCYLEPRWYHRLCANCTTSYYRLPNSRCLLDWRVLANGRLDRALYTAGRLDQSLPFEELPSTLLPERHRKRGPLGRVRGPYPPRTGEAPP